MVEEVKNDQQDQSAETADGVAEDNQAAGAEQDPQSAEGNEAEAGTAPGDVKFIDPPDQTFWEDSVDANSVDLSEGQTESTEEAPATEEKATQPEGEKGETPISKTEETEEASITLTPLGGLPGQEKGKGEDQPSEQEPVAAQEAGSEETKTDTEAPDNACEGPQAKAKVINFYEYLRKKRLLTGIGILLLLTGSIGYAVVPNLRSPGTITATLPGGPPESAYNMKFFLPLKVGYEKAQFVKITIALELIDEGLQKELDKNLSDLRKEVIDLILTKSPKEVRSSGGKRELSREITRRINNYLSRNCIKDTYFTELVIL